MNKKQGFTLIELLFVIAIIGIVVFIAYPSYQHSIIRAYRSDAKLSLLATASHLEQFYFKHDSYLEADKYLHLPYKSSQGFYLIQSRLQSNKYLLTAVPLLTQKSDKDCYIFKYNSNGEKEITGNSGLLTAIECWS